MGGADGPGHCVRNLAFRRTALSAAEATAVRAVAIRGRRPTCRGGISGRAVAAIRGLRGMLDRPSLIIIVGEVT